MKILISGANGMIGKELTKTLEEKGHTVHSLVTKKSDKPKHFLWNIKENYIDEKAFDGIEAIIHLAGAPISKRWTDEYKKEIIDSRVNTANLLFQKIKKLNIPLKTFISASGVNYYGTITTDTIFTENDSTQHQDFLSKVCQKWEAAAFQFKSVTDAVSIVRTSPVLSKQGGMLEQIKPIVKFNLSSPLGSGKQWFPWIHIEDLVGIYIYLIENIDKHGIYNALADEKITNRDFMKTLSNTYKKLFIPIGVPPIMLKIAFGEMSEMLLKGSWCCNNKIKNAGYTLKYPKLSDALVNLKS